jgi:hypothetical protein
VVLLANGNVYAGDQKSDISVRCTDVIRNGNFEAPAPGRPWTGVANTPRMIYNAAFTSNARAHGVAQSGRVGSPTMNSYWSELLQTVQLPARVTSVTLSYWRYLDTAETSRTKANDVFTAGIETEQGIQSVQPQRIDNTSTGRGAWVKSSIVLPKAASYSGQRLWVSFKGTTDGKLPTSLYVDDVQLIVCTG